MSGIAPARAARGRRGLVAALAAAAVLAVHALAVGTGPGRAADAAVLDAAGYATDSQLLGAVGVGSILLAAAVAIGIAIARRRGDLGVVAVAVILGSSGLSRVLKQLVLTRPELAPGPANSYPSGHMVAFAAVAAGLMVVLPPAWRLAVALAAAVVLPLVATRLVLDGWHRPSDVLGSLLLVLAVTALGTAWRAPAPPVDPRRHRLLEGALLALAALAGAVGGALAAASALGGGEGWVLAAASTLLGAACAATLAALVRLLRLAPARRRAGGGAAVRA
ncbi:phosphatase PAP2 family protein [Agrococcus sp. SL85]|uniref:phosphatase PAP2 family protein n=1 Tax=Agrococcus sp. SL85 TaxID=2995141 RepID=UPI00226C6A96|nr:phosphatase PAP2 family protein [Agrococcus sp. SL85]WAC66944.1 phosphatase PAP2 family protein [Agrococcus sp. SL85]